MFEESIHFVKFWTFQLIWNCLSRIMLLCCYIRKGTNQEYYYWVSKDYAAVGLNICEENEILKLIGGTILYNLYYMDF